MAELIGLATINKSGLLQSGGYGNYNDAKSIRLFTTRTINCSIACILSYSTATQNPMNLAYITIGKDSTGNIIANVKYIYTHSSGQLRIVYKRNNDNSVSVYVVREHFTPVYGALMLAPSSMYKEGVMTPLNTNDEIDNTCVDFTIV